MLPLSADQTNLSHDTDWNVIKDELFELLENIREARRGSEAAERREARIHFVFDGHQQLRQRITQPQTEAFPLAKDFVQFRSVLPLYEEETDEGMDDNEFQSVMTKRFLDALPNIRLELSEFAKSFTVNMAREALDAFELAATISNKRVLAVTKPVLDVDFKYQLMYEWSNAVLATVGVLIECCRCGASGSFESFCGESMTLDPSEGPCLCFNAKY